MALHVNSTESKIREPVLGPDFARRLEASLDDADRHRRRHAALQRSTSLLPLVLLIGPIFAWRLILASPDDVHLSIGALSWVAFFLDVGVHVDSALLRYLHLQLLPSIVGTLLFALVTVRLLWNPRGEE